MDTAKTLLRFFSAISDDARIGSTHISVFMALLNMSVSNGKNPVAFKRQDIMRFAKISARDTYNRCMNDLADYGYISYQPSSNGYCLSYAFLHFAEMKQETIDF
jgi:DNA-binding IclR family transcriptional regulator